MQTHTNKRSDVVPIHGNYHGYYSKRPFAEDPRLGLLPDSLFQGARVLDIGCNEGWVTCQIGQTRGAQRVVGVDIDDTLVRAAWKRRRAVWSMQSPLTSSERGSRADDGPVPKKRKRPNEGETEELGCVADYFPASCEHMFGALPVPTKGGDSSNFPHNVVFFTADWVDNEIAEDAAGYDVVLAFSISKWIHLNTGDDGLLRFFKRVFSVLKPGGTFVLEPQQWDTYGKAKRMDQKLKDMAQTLKHRPEDFDRLLQNIGFGPAQHLGATGEGGFHRPVDLYRKQS